MTKEKHNFYSSEEVEQYITKLDRRVSRLLWFTLGFFASTTVAVLIIVFYGK